MYFKSCSTFLQAFLMVSLGPFADEPFWRKTILVGGSSIGSLTGIAYFFFPKVPTVPFVQLATVLGVIGEASYTIVLVCQNAFLPSLAKEDELVGRALEQSNSLPRESQIPHPGLHSAGSLNAVPVPPTAPMTTAAFANHGSVERIPLLSKDGDSDEYRRMLGLTMSRLSAFCAGIGSVSAVGSLIVLNLMVGAMHSTTFSLQISIGLTGAWWLIFLVPSWSRLPGGSRSTGKIEVLQGWRKIRDLIRPQSVRELPQLFKFLGAWMILTDAFYTTPITMLMMAGSRLGMSPAQVIWVAVMPLAAGVVVNIFLPTIQRWLRATNLQILTMLILIASFSAFWGALPIFSATLGGYKSPKDMNTMITFATASGAFFSYARGICAEMIPPGHESSFFSLFGLSNRASSFTGPLVVGLITESTGDLPYAYLFLLLMFWLPLLLLVRVDVKKATEEARVWAEARESIGK